MKKVLFIDRDGTIIAEPVEDLQVDSIEKLEFLPDAIEYLKRIATELDYTLVMVTNQDGLGTDAFPESTFWPAHNLMLETLCEQGVEFEDIYIDKSFEKDNLPTRKPGVGLLGKYIEGNYSLDLSFVIGDRKTDIQLAENLKCKGILFSKDVQIESDALVLSTVSWEEIYNYLRNKN